MERYIAPPLRGIAAPSNARADDMTKKFRLARNTKTADAVSATSALTTTNGNGDPDTLKNKPIMTAQNSAAKTQKNQQSTETAEAKKADHQKVKNWLKAYKTSTDTDAKDRIAHNIYNELSSTPHRHAQENDMGRNDRNDYGRPRSDHDDDQNYRRGNQQSANRYAGDDDYRSNRNEPSRDNRGRYVDPEDYGQAARRAAEGRREYQGTTGRNYYESDYNTNDRDFGRDRDNRFARDEGDYGQNNNQSRYGREDQGRGQYAQQNRYDNNRQQNQSRGNWDEHAQFESQDRYRHQGNRQRDQHETQNRPSGNQDRHSSQQSGGYDNDHDRQYENQNHQGNRSRQQGARDEFRDNDDRLRRSRSLSDSSRSSTRNNTWVNDDTDYTSKGPRM